MKATTKKNIKISRQELETNEVLEATDHALIFLRLHGQKIAAVLIAVLVVYIGVVVWNSRRESTLEKASDRLYELSRDYDKALTEHDWATPERKEAMTKVATAAEELRKEYAALPISRNALFLEANAFFYAGDDVGSVNNTQQAIKLFTDYVNEAKEQGDEFEQAGGMLALGYAQENLSVLTKQTNTEGSRQALVAAVTFYDDVTKLSKAGFLKYEAMNSKARILAEMGRRDDAIALYKQVVKENYRAPKAPAEDASPREQNMFLIRRTMNQFTTAGNALAELSRLGVKTEDVLKELGLAEKA